MMCESCRFGAARGGAPNIDCCATLTAPTNGQLGNYYWAEADRCGCASSCGGRVYLFIVIRRILRGLPMPPLTLGWLE